MRAHPLVAAAQFERDRRAQTYPRRIREQGLDPEAASIDFQCWVAIAEWLETARFFSFAGGASPERDDAPIISWPQLEAAAESARNSIADKVRKQEAERIGNAEKLAELYVRRARLFAIHARVAAMRRSIDGLNAELRARAKEPEPA